MDSYFLPLLPAGGRKADTRIWRSWCRRSSSRSTDRDWRRTRIHRLCPNSMKTAGWRRIICNCPERYLIWQTLSKCFLTNECTYKSIVGTVFRHWRLRVEREHDGPFPWSLLRWNFVMYERQKPFFFLFPRPERQLVAYVHRKAILTMSVAACRE